MIVRLTCSLPITDLEIGCVFILVSVQGGERIFSESSGKEILSVVFSWEHASFFNYTRTGCSIKHAPAS